MMRLHQNLLFYPIRNIFPKARLLKAKKAPDRSVSSMCFFETEGNAEGRLVIAESERFARYAHRYQGCIFLLVGRDGLKSAPKDSCCIALHEDISPTSAYNHILPLFETFKIWEDALEEAVSQSLSYDALIASCGPILTRPLAILDDEFHYVGYSRHLNSSSGYGAAPADGNQYLPLDALNAEANDINRRKFLRERGVYALGGERGSLNKNIFYDGKFAGRVMLPASEDEAENSFDSQVLETVVPYVQRLYASLGTFYRYRSSKTRLRELLESIADEQWVDNDELSGLLENRGYSACDSYYLLKLKSGAGVKRNAYADSPDAGIAAMWPGCTAFKSGGCAFLLANASFFTKGTGRDFVQEVEGFLKDSLLVAGLSRSFSDIHALKAAMSQTQAALDEAQKANSKRSLAKFDDYALLQLAKHGVDGFAPDQVCDPAIRHLREYDSKNSTLLETTLRAYIQNRYNAASTAADLHISRGAFLKRLARIESLTDTNLDDSQQRLYLALSFLIYDIHEEES